MISSRSGMANRNHLQCQFQVSFENTREECCNQLATSAMVMGTGGSGGRVGSTHLPFLLGSPDFAEMSIPFSLDRR